VTRTLGQANHEIQAVDRMPYGLARTQAAERQVRLVDAEGPEAALAYALAVLVESLHWAGEPEKAFLPFTRMVRWWDERPELFDDTDRHTLFWQFKWMVTDLPDYPTVPAAQIDATLDDMERRYALAGNGRDAVAYSRFMWAWNRNAADVERWFQDWAVTPRDAFSQCVTCDPSNRADYLLSSGRVEEAVRLIEETVAAGGACSSEPANMLVNLALGYLDLGRARDAAGAYRRAVAALADAQGEMIWFRGRRIVLLGRGGQPAAAVAAIEDDARLLLDDDVPGSRLAFLQDVVAGTAALLPEHSELPVRAAGVPVSTLGELHAWVVAEAELLVARFDARNGNDGWARSLAEARTTRPSPTPLDLDLRLLAVATSSGSGPAPEPGPSGTTTTAVDHLAQAEEAFTDGRTEDAARSYAAAAAAATDAGLLVDGGFAFAEAARCAQVLGDDETADAL
jgi:tetratricopeptide (TPR) repeat protein